MPISAPPGAPSGDLESLKDEIRQAFFEDPSNLQLILDRIDQLAGADASRLYSRALLLLFNVILNEDEARLLWKAILAHRRELSRRLGREMPLRVAAMDYLVDRNRGVPRSTLLDLLQLHTPPDREITDPVTELHTSGFLADQIPREVGRARRYKLDLSLAHLEIDDFPAVIERQGLAVGTLQLREVSGIITECIRQTDYAARVSGSAFVLLLTETDRIGAYYVADRIRRRVEEHYLQQRLNGRPYGLTVSAGVASFPEDADSPEDLADKAREAFYTARARGQSRVAVHYRERREYMRLALDSEELQVSLVPEGDGNHATGSMKNISSGGVLFESRHPVELGRTVEIQCRRPGDGSAVLIPGRVVRIENFETESGPRYEIGVLFDLVVEEQVEGVVRFLERFISERASEESFGSGGSDQSGPA